MLLYTLSARPGARPPLHDNADDPIRVDTFTRSHDGVQNFDNGKHLLLAPDPIKIPADEAGLRILPHEASRAHSAGAARVLSVRVHEPMLLCWLAEWRS